MTQSSPGATVVDSGPPAVSVVVPCFNLGRHVDEAVESVLVQSYPHVEVLVIDDGSTDPFTIERLSAFDRPKTRVIRTENGGLARARNLGIREARGRYICCLDADDRLESTFLEKAVSILDGFPDIAFVSCWLETFGTESWIWRPDRCDLPMLLAECTVCTAAVVRRAAVLEVGGYDEGMPHQGYEDWDLWIGLGARGFKGTILPEVLFHYRRREGSMSTVCCAGDIHLDLMRYLIDKHRTSYDAHITEVLARKERDTAELLRANYQLERQIDTWLTPEVTRRRGELDRLQHKLERARTALRLQAEHARMAEQIEELSAALTVASLEASALRTSLSWRLTAPLRAVLDLLRWERVS